MNEPIGLLGVLNAGSLAIDLDLGHHRCNTLVDATLAEVVDQVLLEHVADGALRVGAAVVERDLMEFAARHLGAAQDEPDLGAVAVGNGHIPSLSDQGCDVVVGLGCGGVLILDRLVVGVGNQRVAADSDNDCGHYSHAPRTDDSSAMRMTTPL